MILAFLTFAGFLIGLFVGLTKRDSTNHTIWMNDLEARACWQKRALAAERQLRLLRDDTHDADWWK